MTHRKHRPQVPSLAGRRLITTRERKHITGSPSEMTLWRHEQAGIGPKPVRINGRRYWFEDEVYTYLEQLAADRRKAPDAASDDAAEDDESDQSDDAAEVEESGLSEDEESWLAKRLADP